jgi:hypothetical protein
MLKAITALKRSRTLVSNILGHLKTFDKRFTALENDYKIKGNA